MRKHMRSLRPITPSQSLSVLSRLCLQRTWWQGMIMSLVFGSGYMDLHWFELNGGRSLQDFLVCFEMGIAAVAHIYIFPPTPNQRKGHGRRREIVTVLTDYAAIDSPLGPDEVKESKKAAIMKSHEADDQKRREAKSLSESLQEGCIVVGGGHVVHDMRLIVQQAVEPMEKGLRKFNESFDQLPWAKHQNMHGSGSERKKWMSYGRISNNSRESLIL